MDIDVFLSPEISRRQVIIPSLLARDLLRKRPPPFLRHAGALVLPRNLTFLLVPEAILEDAGADPLSTCSCTKFDPSRVSTFSFFSDGVWLWLSLMTTSFELPSCVRKDQEPFIKDTKFPSFKVMLYPFCFIFLKSPLFSFVPCAAPHDPVSNRRIRFFSLHDNSESTRLAQVGMLLVVLRPTSESLPPAAPLR